MINFAALLFVIWMTCKFCMWVGPDFWYWCLAILLCLFVIGMFMQAWEYLMKMGSKK